MRWLSALLIFAPLLANAAQELQVSVVVGRDEPQAYRFPLTDTKQRLDLREKHRYHAAAKDKARKREVCTEAEYKTGLLLTLRAFPQGADGAQQVEVVGQVSNLDSVTDGVALSCGTNQVVKMSHQAFSDTVKIEPNRTKIVVIDGKYTVLLKVI